MLTLFETARIVVAMHVTVWKRPGHASARVVLCLLLLSPLTMHAQNMTPDQERAQASALALAEQARVLEADNQWEKALSLRRKLAAEVIDAFGEVSAQADQARRTIADSLSMLGRYAEARIVLEQCLAARRAALDERHFQVADALIRIGETQRREGLLTNALDSFARAEDIISTQPDQQKLFAVVLNNQALVLNVQGDLRGAEARWTRALPLLASPSDRFFVAEVWSSLADTRRALGRMSESESDHRRAMALLDQAPPQHPLRIMAENKFASLLRELGKTREAIALHERSIAALEAQRGPDDLDVLTMRRNLALALALDHHPAESLRLVEDSLDRLARLKRTSHPLFVTFQTDRADRLMDLGDYDTARQTCESVIERRQRDSGADHPMVWAARERCALVAMRQDDLSAARRQLEAVLEYRRKRAGDSPRQQAELVSTLLEWARFHAALGRQEEAELRLRECLQVAKRYLEPMNPMVAEIWTEAAFLAQSRGRLEESFAYHTTARQIRQKVYGEQGLLTAMTQLNQAEVASLQGRPEMALAEARSALTSFTQLLTETSPLLATARSHLAVHLHRLGQLDEAASFYELALPVLERGQSPTASMVARDASFLQMQRGQWEEAIRNATRASARQEESWRNVLRFASAYDRLAWQGSHDVFSALASAATHDPGPLAQAVLRFKGAVLDSLIEDAQLQAGTPRDTEPLREARRDLYRLEILATGRRPPELNSIRKARVKVEQIESAMAGQVAALDFNRRMFSATVGAVQAVLPPDGVLVEFVRYQHWLGKEGTEDRFGALIYAPAAPLQWVGLGAVAGTNGIRAAVNEWQRTIHARTPPEGGQVTEPLAHLYELVWEKVARLLPPKTRTVIIAPDGELHFVSFAALWKKDHFLGEDLAFRYVASGRDLLAPASPPLLERKVLILADPTYARSGWQRQVVDPLGKTWNALCDVLALRGGSEQDVLPIYGPLPYTLSEAEGVAKLARQHGFKQVQTFTGLDASELNLDQAGTPYLLHLATHGTFLGGATAVHQSANVIDRQATAVPRHPMHRSWVALARANESLDAWRSGRVPDPLRDGLLTAEEAAQLHLRGTWLVTLSACDTGLGASQSGEGVLGLRRGFALAGARHVLMTLWPVQDDHTVEFMKVFYADALASGDAPGALGRTQRKLLAQWRLAKDEGPGRAARFAGPFVISSQGR